jgi:hypothetical protein
MWRPDACRGKVPAGVHDFQATSESRSIGLMGYISHASIRLSREDHPTGDVRMHASAYLFVFRF